MQKVLVLSETERSGEAIQRTIEKALPYQVTYVNDIQGARVQLDSKLFNLILVDCQTVNDTMMARIDWLVQAATKTPVVVFSAKIEDKFMRKLEKWDDLHMLLRPAPERSLITLIKKLMTVRGVPKQRFRRYNTNQAVVFEHVGRGERIPSHMFNLSKGGAYCEFPEGQKLNMGERYRLQIVIGETQRTYTFETVVVWSTPKGKFSGRAGFGVKFLTKS